MTDKAAELAVSVVMPTHNPRMDYLRRVLEALRGQTLAKGLWELIVVDNGSREPLAESIRLTAEGIRSEGESMRQTADGERHEVSLHSHVALGYTSRCLRPPQRTPAPTLPPSTAHLDLSWHENARIVREEKLGLTFARLRGFAEAKGELIVMVDDDNVLNPDYLANAVKIAEEHKELGAFGGKCLPEFETQPEPWMEEFLPLLALRDHGDKEIVAGETRSADGSRRVYPDRAAPIGAGMVVRREAAAAYAEGIKQQAEGIRQTAERPITDRKGDSLASAGDNDLVFTILRDGWKVGYFPQLVVTHLIPSNRLTVDYLARANRGVQRSWVEVLRKHDACPWPIISRTSAPLRKVRAFFKCRGWQRPVGFTRWQGVLGKFDGLQIERVRS